MTEQQRVIGELAGAGVLGGIRWAYGAAVSRTLEIYSEADGHDTTLLGNLRFTLFRDRLDRVFSCDRYELPAGSDASAHLDLLYAELSARDAETMPRLDPRLVRRADLTGSPGWATRGRRFLLAACESGRIASLPWPRRSVTKQRVAAQAQPGGWVQRSLFDGAADAEIAGLEALFAAEQRLDLDTFVVAHSLDPVLARSELVLGRARLNAGGGPAWHWREDLMAEGRPGGSRGRRRGIGPAGPDRAPDAPVRLRKDRPDRKRAGNTA